MCRVSEWHCRFGSITKLVGHCLRLMHDLDDFRHLLLRHGLLFLSRAPFHAHADQEVGHRESRENRENRENRETNFQSQQEWMKAQGNKEELPS